MISVHHNDKTLTKKTHPRCRVKMLKGVVFKWANNLVLSVILGCQSDANHSFCLEENLHKLL